MISSGYLDLFNAIKNKRDFITAIENKRQTHKIKEEFIKNLERKGIKTSFVQVNLNSEKLMIQLNLKSCIR